ncbi:MAG: hypothetical protein ACP5IL_01785 [Syntrophobacteraceae bacterium]
MVTPCYTLQYEAKVMQPRYDIAKIDIGGIVDYSFMSFFSLRHALASRHFTVCKTCPRFDVRSSPDIRATTTSRAMVELSTTRPVRLPFT